VFIDTLTHSARSKHNHRCYAIKVLNKQKVEKMKQAEHSDSESKILGAAQLLLIVDFRGHVAGCAELFLVMDSVCPAATCSLSDFARWKVKAVDGSCG
jgi:serine/threonine protein kinase